MFLEEEGNIWQMDCDALCITTNGHINNDGRLAMGRGLARQVRQKYPDFDLVAGTAVRRKGNIVQVIRRDFESKGTKDILIFPVKHKWWEKADLSLIQSSCIQLRAIADIHEYKRVLLPRPGCGNGRLRWEQVKPAIQGLLDERIVVVHFVIPVVVNN